MLAHELGDGRRQLCPLGKPTQSGSNNKNLYYFMAKKKKKKRTRDGTGSQRSSTRSLKIQFFPSFAFRSLVGQF